MENICRAKPVDGLSERIVVSVADFVDGGIYVGFREPLGVAESDVLPPSIAMMDEALISPTGMQGLLEGIENQRCCRVATLPQPPFRLATTSITKTT
jgi:hypothetical protein